MKKQILSIISFLAISMVFLLACQKDDNSTSPTPKTNTQLISQTTWKFSLATVSGVNVNSSLQPCQKDNIMTFIAAGTGTIDEGPTKCNSGDPQTNPFTWNFASSETMVHISTVLFTGGSSDFTLVTLSETQLVVSQVISGQTVVVTFIH